MESGADLPEHAVRQRRPARAPGRQDRGHGARGSRRACERTCKAARRRGNRHERAGTNGAAPGRGRSGSLPRPSSSEVERQHSQLELIASENFTSEAVLEATASVFTNKYAEGYPGKRYYGGCEFTDVVENLARERAKKLFGAEYANVQPHSGSQANQAAYAAVLHARRHRHGPEPGARRPPHARPPAEFLGQDLQDRPLRRAPGRRAHRLRRAGAAGATSTSRR